MSAPSSSASDPRRTLPSVNALLESEGVRALLASSPRSVVVDAVRSVIDAARQGRLEPPRSEAGRAHAVGAEVTRLRRPSLRPVLNGTGVVLHTNLGRAPLADAALEAIDHVARGFTNLEYDLELGTRGSRYVHAAALLCELTGAGDAI